MPSGATIGGMSRASRDLWRVIEPYHQLAYRSPEAVAAYTAAGVERPDHQYFGSRIAALGPVSARVATAVLFGFAPDYVGRAVPGVWEVASPADVSAARQAGADGTLDRALGDDRDGAAMVEAARLGRTAAEAIDAAGRPLAAAHADLPWPASPSLVLWHACTILREHRGDAHWAATSGEGLDAVECHVLHAADGAMPADMLQRVSGWDDAAWAAGVERLRARGLVTGDDEVVVTDEGRAAKLRVERATDRAAARPLAAIGDDGIARLAVLMRPWVDAIVDKGVVGAWKVREERWRDLPEE